MLNILILHFKFVNWGIGVGLNVLLAIHQKALAPFFGPSRLNGLIVITINW